MRMARGTRIGRVCVWDTQLHRRWKPCSCTPRLSSAPVTRIPRARATAAGPRGIPGSCQRRRAPRCFRCGRWTWRSRVIQSGDARTWRTVSSFRTSQASLCCRPCPRRRGRPACPLALSSPSIVAGPSFCGRCRASASPQMTPISGGQNLSTLALVPPGLHFGARTHRGRSPGR
jgi:hypothetical protein